MLLIDRQYARSLLNRLPLGKVIVASPFRMQHRCIVCGDSATKKHSARAWFYEGTTGKTKGVLLFNCFNCENDGKGAIPFSLFLRQHFQPIYDAYNLEKFKESNRGRSKPKAKKAVGFKARMPKPKPKPKVTALDSEYYISIPDLPDEHPVKRYVKMRCIPEDKWHLLGFASKFKHLSNVVRKDSFSEGSLYYEQPRLIIPIYDRDGLIAIQGRALRKADVPRYQTIKSNEEFQKIYGGERVSSDEEPVPMVEGPIDSLFLVNGMAIVGGAVSPDNAPYPDRRCWWLDNEPRSKDTCSRMQKLITAGERIVLWDKIKPELKRYKDINDCVMKGKCSVQYLNDYMKANIVSGLTAQLRFDKWKKI